MAAGRGERVRENDSALLGQPQRRFIAAASIVEGDKPSRKLAAGLDPLQIGFGDVLAKEETRAEGVGIITAHEQIDVANVIALENDDGSRGTSGEALARTRRPF